MGACHYAFATGATVCIHTRTCELKRGSQITCHPANTSRTQCAIVCLWVEMVFSGICTEQSHPLSTVMAHPKSHEDGKLGKSNMNIKVRASSNTHIAHSVRDWVLVSENGRAHSQEDHMWFHHHTTKRMSAFLSHVKTNLDAKTKSWGVLSFEHPTSRVVVSMQTNSCEIWISKQKSWMSSYENLVVGGVTAPIPISHTRNKSQVSLSHGTWKVIWISKQKVYLIWKQISIPKLKNKRGILSFEHQTLWVVAHKQTISCEKTMRSPSFIWLLVLILKLKPKSWMSSDENLGSLVLQTQFLCLKPETNHQSLSFTWNLMCFSNQNGKFTSLTHQERKVGAVLFLSKFE